MSPAEKMHMLMQLLGGKETCPTCGHEEEVPALITPEDAKKILEGDEV